MFGGASFPSAARSLSAQRDRKKVSTRMALFCTENMDISSRSLTDIDSKCLLHIRFYVIFSTGRGHNEKWKMFLWGIRLSYR